ncbi:MAG: hypothetical protein CSA49_01655 [Gammaproteobacteria bacterium]|nr:MAG: hypothetical protein CSA49_01655 [Gammaproteobacteria bacterium]
MLNRPLKTANPLIRAIFLMAFALVASVVSFNSHAATLEKDGYVIYYSAFNASFITEQVAKAYNLNRSRFRGMINIAVHKKMKDGTTKPVVAQLSGYARRLSGSESPLEFEMVGEGESIYYLAQTIIANRETLRFDIKIKPTPQHTPIKLSFTQDFYTES